MKSVPDLKLCQTIYTCISNPPKVLIDSAEAIYNTTTTWLVFKWTDATFEVRNWKHFSVTTRPQLNYLSSPCQKVGLICVKETEKVCFAVKLSLSKNSHLNISRLLLMTPQRKLTIQKNKELLEGLEGEFNLQL